MFNRKVSIWVIPLVVILSISMTVIGMAWGLQKVTHNAEGALQFLYTLGRIHSGYVGEYTDKKTVRRRHARTGGKPGRSVFRVSE